MGFSGITGVTMGFLELVLLLVVSAVIATPIILATRRSRSERPL